MTPIESNRIIAELKSFGYDILSSGKVVGKKGSILKIHKGSSGYYQLNAHNKGTKKTFSIHRLIAAAFIPNLDNLPEVNHKDGNKSNNTISNLEWCTRSHNIKHGIDTGLIKKSMVGRVGSKHWRSIKVLCYDINGSASEYESTGDAARKTGFNVKSIQDACVGKMKTYKGLKWSYKIYQTQKHTTP